MRKLFLIELNEVNFEFVRRYGARGKLPTLNRLIDAHGLIETTSERDYAALEPWIQWVSAHTGLSYDEHQVFRLGDIVERRDLVQIWEVLEAAGLTVGAISPMNAHNGCAHPAFFVPDPWTRARIDGPGLVKQLYRSIAQVVGDNAEGRVTRQSLAWLAAGMARYARTANYARYLQLGIASSRKPWARAMLLDLLLADLFVGLARRSKIDFGSLFLNAAAHIQHHYMFNAAVYDGPHANPAWYIGRDEDPILEIYALYDLIVEQVMRAFPAHRLLLATGLHQDPYQTLLFYWRLRDHRAFLDELGLVHDRVEPRMSRDFVIYCRDAEAADRAERLLNDVVASDGERLFEVDNRGTTLFVMLVYPHEITKTLGYAAAGRTFSDLAGKTAFVAIKNGEHNGIGYLIDTDGRPAPRTPQRPVTDLFAQIAAHFAVPVPRLEVAA